MDRGRQKAVPAVSVERRIQFNTASDVVAMEEEPKKEEKKEKGYDNYDHAAGLQHTGDRHGQHRQVPDAGLSAAAGGQDEHPGVRGAE